MYGWILLDFFLSRHLLNEVAPTLQLALCKFPRQDFAMNILELPRIRLKWQIKKSREGKQTTTRSILEEKNRRERRGDDSDYED
mmetsp:Transcript_34330/g.51462  ORF Transcript_34330/g.51462 Transcript_34330/m.51462 type:complete len:84 (-) Transcript_34330:112-363(-)